MNGDPFLAGDKMHTNKRGLQEVQNERINNAFHKDFPSFNCNPESGICC